MSSISDLQHKTIRNYKDLAGPAKCGLLPSSECEESGGVSSTTHQQDKEIVDTPAIFK